MGVRGGGGGGELRGCKYCKPALSVVGSAAM